MRLIPGFRALAMTNASTQYTIPIRAVRLSSRGGYLAGTSAGGAHGAGGAGGKRTELSLRHAAEVRCCCCLRSSYGPNRTKA